MCANTFEYLAQKNTIAKVSAYIILKYTYSHTLHICIYAHLNCDI